jgi:hypothetical protein
MHNSNSTRIMRAAAVGGFAVLAGCGYSHNGSGYGSRPPAPPVLPSLATITTIGSAVDPANGDQNPYGLALATVSAGLITAGDLIICDFNDGPTNTQGLGTSVVGLHPAAGSMPYHIAQSTALLGCSAVAVLADGSIAATADQANSLALVQPNGTVVAASPFGGDTFANPWSDVYIPGGGLYGANAALYVSNAGSGAIDRISLGSGDSQSAFTEIATGFSVNGGMPGSISAPAGLTYDASIDTLYVVDTNRNRVIELKNVSQIGTDGVVVNDTAAPPGTATFSGASASSAAVIANGAPLNGPISGALLGNGNLIVGNTLDANGTNLLIEVSPQQGVVAQKNVDTGAAGALFGIVATVNGSGAQLVYFNDDNDNTVKLLSH